MSFISSEIEWVSASMMANILVFNVGLIPTVTFVTAESDEPCLPVTDPVSLSLSPQQTEV